MNYSVSGMKTIFYDSLFGMALLTGLLAGTVAGVSLLTAGLIGKIWMLGTLLEKNFPSGNCPRVFFQMVISQMFNFWGRQLPKSVLAAAFGPLAHPSCSVRPLCSLRRLKRPNLTFGKLPLGKMYIWEVATWEVVTWEVALKKMSLVNYLEPLHLFSMNYLVSMDRPF